jgi:hypothetical protein
MCTLWMLYALYDANPIILLNFVLFLKLLVGNKILNVDIFLATNLEPYYVRLYFSSQ